MDVDKSPERSQSVKKKWKHGRISDTTKKIRTQIHEIDEDYNCTRLKCFETVVEPDRNNIIKHFNGLHVRDSQRLS